jgi:CRISPR-associated protein Cas1
VQELLNTLYVSTQQAYIHLDHDTLRVEVERETKLRVPLIHLGGVVCFGDVLISPALIHRCADDGRFLVWLDRNGRFKARMEGRTSGNVLLRRAQHLALSAPERPLLIASFIVAAKVQNARRALQRAAREATDPVDGGHLRLAVEALNASLEHVQRAPTLDALRGVEGEAARVYFGAFDCMVRVDRPTFALDGRTRRPPRNPMNSLMGLLYALLRTDCEAALQGVGLDPQVGYLHALRPGRPALALDLMEELRVPLVDRLALSLVNRKQIRANDFVMHPGGAVYLGDDARRRVIVAYQERKKEEVPHAALGQKVPFGLVPHVQARLLARHVRGEVDVYLPFVSS